MTLRLFDKTDGNKIGKLYNILREYRYFFDDSTRDNPYTFAQIITNPTSIVLEVGDLDGIFYGYGIEPGANGMCAVAVWSKEYKGERGVALGRNAAEAAIQGKKLHRLTALVAEPNTEAIEFSKKVGFHVEGTMREYLCYNGTWTDVVVLGLLASDIVYAPEEAEDDGRRSSSTIHTGGTGPSE